MSDLIGFHRQMKNTCVGNLHSYQKGLAKNNFAMKMFAPAVVAASITAIPFWVLTSNLKPS